MAAELEIEISAITDKLKKGIDGAVLSLGQLEKEALGINKALETATDPRDIIRLNQALDQTKAAMVNLRTAGLQPLTRAQSQYNSVGIDFARIIQDAPFGIIGVGNNITQLASSFGALRASSSSTGAALKTALGSIFSSGNLLVLGISAATTALTLLSQNGFFKTEKSAKTAKEALDDYRDSLDGLTRSAIEGEAQANREIQNFRLLKAQAENANIPLNTRIEAVKALQSEYPQYLGNLTQEQILTGNVGTAYESLTNQLIATAKARAASDKIAKNSLDLLTIEQQQTERVNAILEKRTQLTRLEALANGQAAKSRGEFTGLDLQILGLRSEIRDLELEQVDSANQRNAILKEDLSLTASINSNIELGAKFTKTQLEEVTKLKRVYEDIANLPRINPLERFDEMTRSFEAPISAESGSALTRGIIIPDIVTPFQEQTVRITELVSELSNSFTGLGSLIGNVFKNPQLGSFLGQFIQFAAKLIATNFKIATSSAIAGASASAAGTGPAAVFTLPAFIASAVGLVAGAFAAFGGGRGSSGVGGSVAQSQTFGGTGEFTNPNDFLSNVVFEIEGTRLVGVLQRTQDRYATG